MFFQLMGFIGLQYIIEILTEDVALIREVVHTGIIEVIHKFQYMSIVKNLEEYFYCTICSNKTIEHFCQLKEDKKTLICCESCTANVIDKTRQQPWFSMNGKF